MDRLKLFLLTTTGLVLSASLSTPVGSQVVTVQPSSRNVTVLATPLQVVQPTAAPPPVSPNIIGQPTPSNVTVLNAPLRVVTPTGVPPSVNPQVVTSQPPSSNVTVVNEPLSVKTQTAAQTPIQIQVSNSTCGSGECSVPLLTVPQGKRLVVEYLTANTRILPAGASGASASILLFTEFLGESQKIPVGLTKNNGPGLNSLDVLAEVTKLYADPGTNVTCGMVVPNFENIDFLNCSITGFLEDVS